MDFTKFDSQVDKQKLKDQVNTAQENSFDEDLPEGYYYGEFEKFELRETKDGRPMFSCQFRIHGTYMRTAKIWKRQRPNMRINAYL